MFIQTEQTPNPATLKFLPGRDVLGSGSADFPTKDDAAPSPLAKALFEIDGVTGVFLGPDFVTVTKRDDQEWYILKPAVLGAIMEHFTAGRPVIEESGAGATVEESYNEDDAEVVEEIKEILDTRVRPAVAQDGGDIVFQGFDDGVVFLHLQGSCSGCPSSVLTLKAGIERMLTHYCPEVSEVRAQG